MVLSPAAIPTKRSTLALVGANVQDPNDLLFELPAAQPGTREVLVKTPEYSVWTAAKARLIAKYIYFFEMITKHGTYIDGFAGPQSPDTPDSWAAQMVLDLDPLWLRHFHLCDNRTAQVEALHQLAQRHPSLDIRVYEGDFNQKVDDILRPGVLLKEATFCLLDQRTFECRWETVEKLARFKSGRSDMKIELFYFWLRAGWTGLSREWGS